MMESIETNSSCSFGRHYAHETNFGNVAFDSGVDAEVLPFEVCMLEAGGGCRDSSSARINDEDNGDDDDNNISRPPQQRGFCSDMLRHPLLIYNAGAAASASTASTATTTTTNASGNMAHFKQSPRERVDRISIERHSRAFQQLEFVIDRLAEESAKAQGLRAPVTRLSRLMDSSPDFLPQRIYVFALAPHDNRQYRDAVALLKVGWKRLLLLDTGHELHHVVALCVLDFCVRFEHRRKGIGRKLFDYMLLYEQRHPWELPIDNPSAKMKSFLRRHYGLDVETDAIPQLNRFTVFRGFDFERTTNVDAEHRHECYQGRHDIADEELRDASDGRGVFLSERQEHETLSGGRHRSRRRSDRRQQAPRHSSEHPLCCAHMTTTTTTTGAQPCHIRDGESSNDFLIHAPRRSIQCCCNEEYNRQQFLRPMQSEHVQLTKSDLRRTSGMFRSTSCSSWRVLGLEGPGNLNHHIS